jgi:hypothetical protein
MNQIRAELEHVMHEAGGGLRPADVHEFARDPTTAIHGKLEWDDAKAGYAHRLEQIRALIRVHMDTLAPDTEPVRVFTSLRVDRASGNGYRSTGAVMRSADMRAQQLEEALAEADRWMQKYHRLVELADVFAALGSVRKRRPQPRPDDAPTAFC